MLTANKMNEGMGGEKGKGLGERKPHDLLLSEIFTLQRFMILLSIMDCWHIKSYRIKECRGIQENELSI